MKTFKEYLHENYDMPGFQGAGLSSSHIPYDIEDQEVKNKINAILGHTAVSEFMNPKAAIAQMESKLSMLGLHRKHSVEGHG